MQRLRYNNTFTGRMFTQVVVKTCDLSIWCLSLFMYVYSYCNALSARFFAVDRALNSYFMIMITGIGSHGI